MGVQYYWRANGGAMRGPVDPDRMRELARTGAIRPETRVRRADGGRWDLAARVDGLAFPLSAAQRDTVTRNEALDADGVEDDPPPTLARDRPEPPRDHYVGGLHELGLHLLWLDDERVVAMLDQRVRDVSLRDAVFGRVGRLVVTNRRAISATPRGDGHSCDVQIRRIDPGTSIAFTPTQDPFADVLAALAAMAGTVVLAAALIQSSALIAISALFLFAAAVCLLARGRRRALVFGETRPLVFPTSSVPLHTVSLITNELAAA